MVIFLKGMLRELDYFIDCMSEEIEEKYVLDLSQKEWEKQVEKILSFIDEDTKVITFNNVGVGIIYGGEYLWRKKGVCLYNYYVDHPVHYIDTLDIGMENMRVITVDKQHKQFLQRYYPGLKAVEYLPHGGKRYLLSEIPYEERKISLLYLGSCQRMKDYVGELACLPDGGRELYNMAFQMIEKYSFLSIDQFFDIYVKEYRLQLGDQEKKFCLKALYDFVCSYVRKKFKEKIMETLAENEIEIEIYGENWEKLEEKYPKYIHTHKRILPEKCMELICNAKVVLNIMPWFKDGAHERIYNAMLNGAVCVTDESAYLKQHFKNGDNIVFYDLQNLDVLASNIRFLLDNPDYAKQIIERQRKTICNSEWKHRIKNILEDRFEEDKFI